MISLKVNVSRSGKDEIQTCDEMQPCDEYSYVNKSIFTSDVRNVVKEYTRRYGDVDYDGVKDKVKAITPVPGGVGPMTITMLLYNVLKAYKIQNKI